MEDVKLLKELEIFRDLSSFEILNVAKLLNSRSFSKGDKIVNQGEEGDSLFIVKSGEVLVSRENGKGNAETLASLGEGAHFGEIALIDQQPRSANVSATINSKLLQMKKEDLDKLLSKNVELAMKIYKAFAVALCKRLRDTNETIFLYKQEVE